MNEEPWHPLRDIQGVRDIMDSFLQGALGSSGSFPVDIAESQTSYTVRASLPGIKPEDIDVRVEGNLLTIHGATKTEQEQQGQDQRWLRREHRAASFHRTMTLPTPINAEQVQATYENGVLQLTLPKAATTPAKQIKINSGNHPQAPAVTTDKTSVDEVTETSMDSFPASDPPSTSAAT